MSDVVRLNPQAMSRGNEALMSSIVVDEGETFVSVDLTSGEPSVTSHFSKDPRYIYANFTGIGKLPFYENKVLMLDDMYLMGASISPTGRDAMKEAFHSTWGGNTFSEQWVEDKEVITKDPSINPIRASHKTQVLAMQYGQGAQGMVTSAADDGITLKFNDAKAFHRMFWNDLFPKVRDLGKRLQLQNKSQGYIVNEFGFRLFPALYKSLNYFIQSSVSGVIDMLMINFYTLAPYCNHLAIIHDELVFSCPDDKLVEAKEAMRQALKALNDTLNWSVNIRTGWVEGKDFYEAH